MSDDTEQWHYPDWRLNQTTPSLVGSIVQHQHHLGTFHPACSAPMLSLSQSMDEASQPPPSPMLDALFGTSNIFPFENCKGQSVDQNYERAAEYYEAATRQGVAEAQFNLGALYAHGQGVEQSFETAREWWMKAAEQGHEKAIENLRRLLTKLKEEQHPLHTTQTMLHLRHLQDIHPQIKKLQ